MLLLSVAPLVKTISFGSAFISCATCCKQVQHTALSMVYTIPYVPALSPHSMPITIKRDTTNSLLISYKLIIFVLFSNQFCASTKVRGPNTNAILLRTWLKQEPILRDIRIRRKSNDRTSSRTKLSSKAEDTRGQKPTMVFCSSVENQQLRQLAPTC